MFEQKERAAPDAATKPTMLVKPRPKTKTTGPAIPLPGGGRLAAIEFLKRLLHETDGNALPDAAAQVAFYLLFAVFPFLFFLTTLTAYLPLTLGTNEILSRMADVLPKDALGLISNHFTTLRSQPRPSILTLALVGALWSASRGVDAVRTALNRAYGVKETRAWWRLQILALVVTVVGAVLVLSAVTLLTLGGKAGWYVAHWAGISGAYQWTMHWARWPIASLVIMLVAAMGYYVLPDVEQKFRYITPGSVSGTLLWLGATWIFGEYVAHFGTYSVTYGTLGGVVILLTWFLISGFVFLLGGEVNAVLEQASIAGKSKGEHVEHESASAVDRPAH